jgi:hypothetical protein
VLALWLILGLAVVAAVVSGAIVAYRRRPYIVAQNAMRRIDRIADRAMADMARDVGGGSGGRSFDDWLR